MVRELQELLKHRFPIKHIWQEDIGFRKPRILNETVRQSSGDYLIFIDGDCMAQACLFRALSELIGTYGEEATAHFTENLPTRIKNGEFEGERLEQWTYPSID